MFVIFAMFLHGIFCTIFSFVFWTNLTQQYAAAKKILTKNGSKNLVEREEKAEEYDTSNLLYGGVWKKELTKVSIHDEDVNKAYIFFLRYLERRGDLSKITEYGVKLFRVYNIRKKAIHYTENRSGPLYVRVKISYGDPKILQPITLPVTFGSLIQFDIIWKTGEFTQYHNITISEYTKFQFHIYSHTFYRHFFNPLQQPTTCPHLIDGTLSSSITHNTPNTDRVHKFQENRADKTTKRKKLQLDVLRDQINPVNPLLYTTPDQVKGHPVSEISSSMLSEKRKQNQPVKSTVTTIKNDLSQVTIKTRRIPPKKMDKSPDVSETHKINKSNNHVLRDNSKVAKNLISKEGISEVIPKTSLDITLKSQDNIKDMSDANRIKDSSQITTKPIQDSSQVKSKPVEDSSQVKAKHIKSKKVAAQILPETNKGISKTKLTREDKTQTKLLKTKEDSFHIKPKPSRDNSYLSSNRDSFQVTLETESTDQSNKDISKNKLNKDDKTSPAFPWFYIKSDKETCPKSDTVHKSVYFDIYDENTPICGIENVPSETESINIDVNEAGTVCLMDGKSIICSDKQTEISYFTDKNGNIHMHETIVTSDAVYTRSMRSACTISEIPTEIIFPNSSKEIWLRFMMSHWMCLKGSEPGYGCCQVSILSYNIWHYNSVTNDVEGYVKRMTALRKVLGDAAADIIGLQEVRFELNKGGELGSHQMDYIMSILTEYQFVYQPAMLMSSSVTEGKTEEGLAIITKYEIKSHDYILLYRNESNTADHTQRICLHAEIFIPGVGTVHVFNVHLSLSSESRDISIKQVWRYMKQFKGPSILLGDFNAEPHEQSIQFLTKQKNVIDIWPYLHEKQTPGYTFSALHKYLEKRIDYIFFIKEDNTQILNIKLLEENHHGSSAASDHLPVLAAIGLNCPQKS